MHVLPFEKPVAELAEKLRELRLKAGKDEALRPELAELEAEVGRVAKEHFRDLTPHQKVQISRHADRPYTLDYAKRLLTDFVELKGDRRFADDASIVAGVGSFRGRSVALVGHQKGRGTKENMKRNFGMPHPEGYRKALRLMKLAEKFHVPVFTFIDTPGAWAGLGAEERGQAEAIARNLFEMSSLETPIIATVIGEGGSGGALALGVADRVLMLENAVYSVITVEGCAAILWKDGKSPEMREKAAGALKITAQDLLELGVIDEIIPEPLGGAHANHEVAAAALQETLIKHYEELRRYKPEKLVRKRREKFLKMGKFSE